MMCVLQGHTVTRSTPTHRSACSWATHTHACMNKWSSSDAWVRALHGHGRSLLASTACHCQSAGVRGATDQRRGFQLSMGWDARVCCCSLRSPLMAVLRALLRVFFFFFSGSRSAHARRASPRSGSGRSWWPRRPSILLSHPSCLNFYFSSS